MKRERTKNRREQGGESRNRRGRGEEKGRRNMKESESFNCLNREQKHKTRKRKK